jgi:hypothetical protein
MRGCIILVFFADRFSSKTNSLLGADFVEDKELGNAFLDVFAVAVEGDAKGVSILVLSGFGASIAFVAFGYCKHLHNCVKSPVCRTCLILC